jgi:hypothetical protein
MLVRGRGNKLRVSIQVFLGLWFSYREQNLGPSAVRLNVGWFPLITQPAFGPLGFVSAGEGVDGFIECSTRGVWQGRPGD